MAVVCRRTGLKPDLLRAWERRYAVVTPGRSASGRRLYSDVDLDHLLLLKRAVDGGRAIGQLARLGAAEIAALVLDDERNRPASNPARDGERRTCAAAVAACLAAVRALDPDRLSYELERATLELSRWALLQDLVGPLMQAIGDEWQEGGLSPAFEHAASVVIRNYLARLPTPPVNHGRLAIAVTPAGELHEIGALMAAATAAACGWKVLYLGPSLPAQDIAAAATTSGARVILLSLVLDGGSATVREVELLAGLVGPVGGQDVRILVGGRAAPHYAGPLRRGGCELPGDLAGLRVSLAATDS
jgi:DNA-binding transcriptional MerR regulator/methylmalonyl-CoA mutase cobalamin-binding subunit